MPTGVRKCKVCGCEYTYCKTNRNPNIFRYQDVACCPEHGSVYFAKIMESRSEASTSVEPTDVKSEQSTTVIHEYEEDDELFEEDFDDNAEEPAIETR